MTGSVAVVVLTIAGLLLFAMGVVSALAHITLALAGRAAPDTGTRLACAALCAAAGASAVIVVGVLA